jgi:hypothetical protein
MTSKDSLNGYDYKNQAWVKTANISDVVTKSPANATAGFMRVNKSQ